jgi:hypothetical protein
MEGNVNQDLISYINERRQNGIGDDEIKNNLIEAGWKESDINDALGREVDVKLKTTSSKNLVALNGETSKSVNSNINPQELEQVLSKWNWGAFLLTWIWSVAHGVWWGLSALIPIPGVSLIVGILLGIKGSRSAWENKKYSSIQEFNESQKNWTIAGLVVIAVNIIAIIAIIYIVFGNLNNMQKNADDASIRSALSSTIVYASSCREEGGNITNSGNSYNGVIQAGYPICDKEDINFGGQHWPEMPSNSNKVVLFDGNTDNWVITTTLPNGNIYRCTTDGCNVTTMLDSH